MEEGSFKRKLSPSEGPSKRFRDSGIEISFTENQPIIAHAGTIKKVTLLNFMCHEALEVKLSHAVNFITGRNGTGKSAILTAIVIGLGGKAINTNRGCSLKEFIKSNERSTLVETVICNTGHNAFQPNIYGDEIIVQRTINANSNNHYKIMSSGGNMISNKHEDLQRILLSLNLQVDNPVAILTQDTARNFLHNTRPTDKYLFFLKATRLENIESIYKRVYQSLVVINEAQIFRSKRLDAYKEQKNDLEKRLKHLQSMEQTRDRLEVCQNELYWAYVSQQECKLEEIEFACNEQDKLCQQNIAEISGLESKIKKISDNKREIEETSQKLLKESSDYNLKCVELKKATEVLNRKCKDKEDDIDAKNEEVSRIKNNIETLNKQIIKLQNTLNQEGPTRKQDLESSIAVLEKERDETEAQVKTHHLHLSQLQSALIHDRESVQSLEEELKGFKVKIAKTQSKLRSLEGQGESILKLFGDYVIRLNREIQEAYEKGVFSELPRGPIGSFIKVKDKSWAPAVESIIGSEILRSYYVNSHQDRKALYELMNKIIGNKIPLPSVTSTKFMNKVYDYSRNAVKCPGYCSVLDMLEVTEPLVTNCLIDLIGIESILLVESPRDAREMMKCERNVPWNCKKVVTKTGDTLYPDPNYRCYSGDDRTEAKFLQVSVEEVKRGLNAEISDCKKWASNTTSQKTEVEKRIELHKIEIKKAEDLVFQLSSKKVSIANKLRELQQIDYTDVNHIDFWIDERDSLKPQLEQAKELLSLSKQEHKNLQIDHGELLQKYEKLKETSKKKSREIDFLVSESNNLDNKIMHANLSQKTLLKKKAECEKHLATIMSQVNKQKELVIKSIADALTLTNERINTTRLVSEISEEIQELKNKIERVERSEGNPKEIGEQFNGVKSKCDELARKIFALDICREKLKNMLKHRRKIYSKCLQLLVTRVKMVFQSLIDRRRFQGGIEVNHKEQKLDIKVTLRDPRPKKQLRAGMKRGAESAAGADPKSLSGGERSFSTVAFILALWDAVELPFYALDEFDVFMDNANREWTLNLLMNHAKEKKDFQYVFLTPQPVPSLAGEKNVTVYSLQPHEAQTKEIC